jgi:hypothetical protein
MKTVYNAWAQAEILEKYNDDSQCFAREVHAMYPDIYLEHTGGGCTALMKVLADGRTCVYTTDASAPIAPNDDDMVTVCIYDYSEDGWGSCDEAGWEFHDELKTCKDAIEFMAALPAAGEVADRAYRCVWGEAYPQPDHHWDHGQRDYFFFRESTGYSPEDIAAIRALEIGRAYTVDSGMAGEHMTAVRFR